MYFLSAGSYSAKKRRVEERGRGEKNRRRPVCIFIIINNYLRGPSSSYKGRVIVSIILLFEEDGLSPYTIGHEKRLEQLYNFIYDANITLSSRP